ncbi:Hemin uptake protein hemP [Stieleria maiorica]|uniref:Hemin uptake protein hemP n=2 Tax=Stieleria maiorica TaxID=2795974 RepID=A0A5B9MDI4_9BACT|nr:Hemin uptake protein hemP [Stieleria maiorica]
MLCFREFGSHRKNGGKKFSQRMLTKSKNAGLLLRLTRNNVAAQRLTPPFLAYPMSSNSADKPDSSLSELAGANLENSLRKIVRFVDLARCGDEVWIEYEGKLYRLQSTRQGKLVLTK